MIYAPTRALRDATRAKARVLPAFGALLWISLFFDNAGKNPTHMYSGLLASS